MLADIELAQTLKSETEKAQEEMIEKVPHQLDQDYASLNCKLSLLDKKSKTYKVLCLDTNAHNPFSHPILCLSCVL